MQLFWDKLKGWGPGISDLALRVLAAAVILLIANRIVRVVRRLVNNALERSSADRVVSRFLMTAAEIGIYALAVFMAADSLGIPTASTVTLLGSAGLAVGLALQESLKNVAGGIMIMLVHPFDVGEYILFEDQEGTVEKVGLIYTTLMTPNQRKITIPNGSISNGVVVNVTGQGKRRLDLEIGIGYGSDLKLAKTNLRGLFGSHPLVLQEEGVTVYVGELGESAVTVGVRGFTTTEDYWTVRWEMIESIKERFDQAGIEIPYRKMDVRLVDGKAGDRASCRERDG